MENLEQDKLARAKEKVQKIKKFYEHLTSYTVVILGLATLNFYQNNLREPWFLWPALGWGIGIIFNAISAFNYSPFFNENWEEQKIQELIQKDEKTDRWE